MKQGKIASSNGRIQSIKYVARLQVLLFVVVFAIVAMLIKRSDATRPVMLKQKPIARYTTRSNSNMPKININAKQLGSSNSNFMAEAAKSTEAAKQQGLLAAESTTKSNVMCASKEMFERAIEERVNLAIHAIKAATANATECTPAEEEGFQWSWMNILKLCLAGVLLCFSALFSGLTLGLMGQDKVTLEILSTSGDEKERVYAKRILPVRRRGNLLLTTLLLGNVMVNAGISILTSDVLSGIWAFLISSALITIFGEIVPQAFCSRHGLLIGAYTVWIVYILMALMFVIAFPISFILDRILGSEIGTIYSKNELKQLVEIHAKHNKESGLQQHEAKILSGALDYANKTVKEVMTPLSSAFMLEINEKLDVDIMTKIWETGHSRIPIYKEDKNNIISILFTKDLVLINPEDELAISTVLAFYGRDAVKIFPDVHLDELLLQFKTGKTHIAIVHEPVEPEDGGDPYYKTLGIVTLEDVIEEIIRDEIIDETDELVQQTGENGESMTVMKKHRVSVNEITRKSKTHRLSPKQVSAVVSYMVKMIPTVQLIPEEYMKSLLSHAPIVHFAPTAAEKNEVHQIYSKGKASENFILVLSGKAEVLSGADSFVSENGPWSWIGLRALTTPEFIPDFDCRATKAVSYIQISRTEFISTIEMIVHEQPNWVLPKALAWVETKFKPKGVARITPAHSSVSPTHYTLHPNSAAKTTSVTTTAASSPQQPASPSQANTTIGEVAIEIASVQQQQQLELTVTPPTSPELKVISKRDEKKSLLQSIAEEADDDTTI